MDSYTGCRLCNLNNIVFFIGIASAVSNDLMQSPSDRIALSI